MGSSSRLDTGELDDIAFPVVHPLTSRPSYSIASTEVATAAVQSGARLITHLFNAMPQLHHRDPSIIGLLGASPHLSSPSSPTSPVSATFPRTSALHRVSSVVKRAAAEKGPQATSEAFDDVQTPPQTPVLAPSDAMADLGLTKGKVADLAFERPFYELIVDGIHSHPNSVRVSTSPVSRCDRDTSLTRAPSSRTRRTPTGASSSRTR